MLTMKIGTKSVLFGAHCFLIHPWFVALAWWKLYGFPWNPLLWLCFFVHDLGYIGKPNMDGKEGESHPYFGARLMKVFGRRWYNMCLYHSRFLSKQHHVRFSKLCVADKMSFCLTPMWLYLPMVKATGEIKEYMGKVDDKYSTMGLSKDGEVKWFKSVSNYLYKWAMEHRDLKTDNWTPEYVK